MNDKNQQNWEQKLQDFETKINRAFAEGKTTPTETVRPLLETETSQKFTDLLKSAKNWLLTLPMPIRVIVLILLVIAVLSLLNTVLRLLSALMILAVLGILGYFLIKSVKESKSKTKPTQK
jgi:hypothetical protein